MNRWSVLAIVLLSLLAALPAFAQITLERSELPQQIGDSMRHKYNIGTATVQVLEPGGPQTWEFDTAGFTGGLRWNTIIDPADAPFPELFPDLNRVERTTPDSGDYSGFTYIRLDDDALNLLGLGYSDSETTYANAYDSWFKMLALPVTFGDAWDGATSWQMYINDSVYSTCERWSHLSIDAWGTAVLPMGSFECLRLNCYDTLISTLWRSGNPVFSDTTGYRGYEWWAENHGLVASATGPMDDTSLVFTESDCYWIMTDHVLGAIAERATPSARSQLRVASPFTDFTVAIGREREQFEILSVTGRRVAVQPGARIGSGLPAGVYLVRGTRDTSPVRVVKAQ
jgi:hypothetical protein